MIDRNFIKYIAIGLLNTLFGYGLIFLFFFYGVIAEVSNLLGYVAGFLLSYFLNKKYNFKSDSTHKKDFPKFILSMFIAYLANLSTMVFFYRYLQYDFYISQIVAGVVYMFIGYFLSKNYVFVKE